jgi:2-haloacid dehalogenase
MAPRNSEDPLSLILLDVNETISDMAPLLDVFKGLGSPPEALDCWLAATLRDGIALAAAGGYAEFESLAGDALDAQFADLPPAARERGRAEVLDAFGKLGAHEDIRPGLEAARELGLPVATLSNGSVDYTEALLARAGLADLVTRSFSVAEVGRWKPAPEPYLHAAAASGLAPAELALIAVHPWDVDGAGRAGARSGWLNRSGRPFPRSLRPAEVEGGTLTDVIRNLAEPN